MWSPHQFVTWFIIKDNLLSYFVTPFSSTSAPVKYCNFIPGALSFLDYCSFLHRIRNHFLNFFQNSCEGNWIFLTACESLRNLYINNTRMIRSFDCSAWTFSKFTLEGIIFLCRSHIPVFYLPIIFQNFGNGISGRSQSVVSEWWNYRLGLISLNKIWSKQKLDVPVVIFSPGSQNKPFVLFHGELCNGFVCIICVE